MASHGKTKIRISQQYQHYQQQFNHLKNVNRQFGDQTLSDIGSESFTLPSKCLETGRNTSNMSSDWKNLPFAFPIMEENHEKAQQINEILSFSMHQQKDDEVSNNSGFVVILVSRCLTAVGIDNRIDSGYRHTKDKSLPHVWLIIEGYVIDNTYTKELQDHSTRYLCKTTPKCYESYDFSMSENHIPNVKHNAKNVFEISVLKKRANFYIRKPDKTLALGLNREQLFNYYFAMIRYMYNVYGVCVTGIDPKIRYVCWWCEKYPKSGRNFLSDIMGRCDFKETNTSSKLTWKFLHCSRCMVANYCGPQCQRSDWADIHSLVCLSRGCVYLPPLGDTPFTSDPIP